MPRAARTVINHDGPSRCSGRGGDRQAGTKPAELKGAAFYFTSSARECPLRTRRDLQKQPLRKRYAGAPGNPRKKDRRVI